MKNGEIQADLQTAQNRMFAFIENNLQASENNCRIDHLLQSPGEIPAIYEAVKHQLFSLFNIPIAKQQQWHMGITDSGKRAIELLVNNLCPPANGANIAVNTENYVTFNKFSAASSLKSQKDIAFETPFALKMGQALTINGEKELVRAHNLLEHQDTRTFWLAWNSTSTGIKENVETLVRHRNTTGSKALIVADAASLPLFTNDWKKTAPEELPDVFFFSLRKQALPYDGPQDEANQARNSGSLFFFNDRALARAKEIGCPTLYDSPSFSEFSEHMITKGEQRRNHIKHLLKLDVAMNEFLQKNGEKLVTQDTIRTSIHQEILTAFNGGILSQKEFSLLASPKAQSETAYIVKMPPGSSPLQTLSRLKDRGIYLSVSMHPQVSNKEHLRFACYPANTLEETRLLLTGLAEETYLS